VFQLAIVSGEMVGSNMVEKNSRSLIDERSRDDGPWHQGTKGERIAIRRSSRETHGAYAIVESVAEPGCGVPLHFHKNEEEHFVVIEGAYRFVCDDRMFDAAAGTRFTVPKGAEHAWRNIAEGASRMLVILTPGGFERCIEEIKNCSPDNIHEFAASFGCLITGPVTEM
jgi:mannose-6-phosphate isomerase-like protein (cupin superfamily)